MILMYLVSLWNIHPFSRQDREQGRPILCVFPWNFWFSTTHFEVWYLDMRYLKNTTQFIANILLPWQNRNHNHDLCGQVTLFTGSLTYLCNGFSLDNELLSYFDWPTTWPGTHSLWKSCGREQTAALICDWRVSSKSGERQNRDGKSADRQ